MKLLGQRHRRDGTGEHPGALQRDQAVALYLNDLVEQVLDPRSGVDRHRHQGEVLGQGEQPIGPAPVLQAKPFGAAEHHARLDLPAAVEVEQRVSDEPVLGAVALAEVRGELETVRVHGSRSPQLSCAGWDLSEEIPRER